MTLEQSILLIISFTLTITSMTVIGYNSKDIRDLKREISRLKDEVHILKLKQDWKDNE